MDDHGGRQSAATSGSEQKAKTHFHGASCGVWQRRRSRFAAWQLMCMVVLASLCTAAAFCIRLCKNKVEHDGCSTTCKIEKVAYMSWYNTSDCSGKILMQLAFNDRNHEHCLWTRNGNDLTDEQWESWSTKWSQQKAQNNPVFGIPPVDGVVGIPRPECFPYTTGLSQNHVMSYRLSCHVSYPRLSTVDNESISGAFVINKHWKLAVGDNQTWEETRARAIAHNQPDYYEAFAQRVCIPSFKFLLPDDSSFKILNYPFNGRLLVAGFEYHDPVTQRVKVGCKDDKCSDCTAEKPMAQLSCSDSVTCQMLSPGRCFVCSGGVADKPQEGFQIYPGPPAPAPYTCLPCSQAPTNYFYANTDCQAGKGCGRCGYDLPAWPVVFWPGMACGACGQKDAPITACGDQRAGGAPYFWVNAHHDMAGSVMQQPQLLSSDTNMPEPGAHQQLQ